MKKYQLYILRDGVMCLYDTYSTRRSAINVAEVLYPGRFTSKPRWEIRTYREDKGVTTAPASLNVDVDEEYWFRIEVFSTSTAKWHRSSTYPEEYRRYGAWRRAEELRKDHGQWNVRVVADHPLVSQELLEEYTVRVTYTVMAKGFDDAKLRYRSGTYVQTDVTSTGKEG